MRPIEHSINKRCGMETEYSHEETSRKVPTIHIRPATAADDATIRRMVRAEHLDPTSLKWQNFMVVEQDGKVIGIGQVKTLPGCQELGSLVVLPEYRGQGIAAELITALEARTGRPLYLLCQNQMASYYARFGYQQISYRDVPRFLKLKMLVPMTFRLFGVRIVILRKD